MSEELESTPAIESGISDAQRQAENRAKWYAALESGKYLQARECLRDGAGGRCCLGVACDVLKPANARWRKTKHDSWMILGEESWLPAPIAVQLGLPFRGQFPDGKQLTVRGQYTVNSLAECNDYASCTFREIAAIARYVWDGGSKPEGVEVVS